jgi:hypothetical protein
MRGGAWMGSRSVVARDAWRLSRGCASCVVCCMACRVCVGRLPWWPTSAWWCAMRHRHRPRGSRDALSVCAWAACAASWAASPAACPSTTTVQPTPRAACCCCCCCCYDPPLPGSGASWWRRSLGCIGVCVWWCRMIECMFVYVCPPSPPPCGVRCACACVNACVARACGSRCVGEPMRKREEAACPFVPSLLPPPPSPTPLPPTAPCLSPRRHLVRQCVVDCMPGRDRVRRSCVVRRDACACVCVLRMADCVRRVCGTSVVVECERAGAACVRACVVCVVVCGIAEHVQHRQGRHVFVCVDSRVVWWRRAWWYRVVVL